MSPIIRDVELGKESFHKHLSCVYLGSHFGSPRSMVETGYKLM